MGGNSVYENSAQQYSETKQSFARFMSSIYAWVASGLLISTITVYLIIYSDNFLSVAFWKLLAAMSIIGFTTKKDLSKLGGILLSMLMGLIIASLVNLFLLKSSAGDFILSIITIIIFVGLTAYDTQKCKVLYHKFSDQGILSRLVIGLALELYLDFINLFLSILRIFGNRK